MFATYFASCPAEQGWCTRERNVRFALSGEICGGGVLLGVAFTGEPPACDRYNDSKDNQDIVRGSQPPKPTCALSALCGA